VPEAAAAERDLLTRVRRRRLVWLGLALAAGLAALAAGLAFRGGGGASAGEPAEAAAGTSLATIGRRDLASQVQVAGTLGYGGSSSIVVPAGTAPSAVRQARQAVAASEVGLRTAEATLGADRHALEQARGPAADAARARVTADQGAVDTARVDRAGARAGLAAGNASAAAYEPGTVLTMLPAPGRVVRRGRPLYAVGGRPVLLLYGLVTPWRAFRAGMSPGPDVAALNANLRALGYGAPAGRDFTGSTAAAIRRLQAAVGLPETGRLLLGSVAFAPGPVRVKRAAALVGQAVQPGPLLTVSSIRHQVSIALDAAQQSSVSVGDRVTISLPNLTTTPGVVSRVGSVASAAAPGKAPTIDVGVRLAHERAAGKLDGAPVQVSITTETARNVLSVPVASLLARPGGAYAIEVVDGAGIHRLVTVRLGLFDDAHGLVQVSGRGLRPGLRIVVPGS
jgi:peptidoglycan hydrolase-like protein with peptidoglycan-binding domain